MTEHEDKVLAAKQAASFDLIDNAIDFATINGLELASFVLDKEGKAKEAFFQKRLDDAKCE